MTCFPIRDRRGNQNENKYRGDGFQCGNKEVAEQHHRLRGVRRDQREDNSENDTDGDLQHQAARHDAVKQCLNTHGVR